MSPQGEPITGTLGNTPWHELQSPVLAGAFMSRVPPSVKTIDAAKGNFKSMVRKKFEYALVRILISIPFASRTRTSRTELSRTTEPDTGNSESWQQAHGVPQRSSVFTPLAQLGAGATGVVFSPQHKKKRIKKMKSNLVLNTACFLSATAVLALSSCRPANLIHARVLDGATGTPMANVIVVGEKGGLYIDNPDKTLGNPSYVSGAVTDNDGVFILPLDGIQLVGLHTFFEGYRYGQTTIEGIGYAVTEITMGKQLAKDLPPTLSNARISKETVAPGEQITVTVVAKAGTPDDPMSEEVVIVEDTTGFGIAMAPPAPGGRPGAWPDGTWTATFAAPKIKGTYMFHIASTSEGCVNSNEIPWQLTVQ